MDFPRASGMNFPASPNVLNVLWMAHMSQSAWPTTTPELCQPTIVYPKPHHTHTTPSHHPPNLNQCVGVQPCWQAFFWFAFWWASSTHLVCLTWPLNDVQTHRFTITKTSKPPIATHPKIQNPISNLNWQTSSLQHHYPNNMQHHISYSKHCITHQSKCKFRTCNSHPQIQKPKSWSAKCDLEILICKAPKTHKSNTTYSRQLHISYQCKANTQQPTSDAQSKMQKSKSQMPNPKLECHICEIQHINCQASHTTTWTPMTHIQSACHCVNKDQAHHELCGQLDIVPVPVGFPTLADEIQNHLKVCHGQGTGIHEVVCTGHAFKGFRV